MVRLARAAILTLGVAFCACPAVYAAETSTESEAVITGRVVDGETGAPVALARVELDDTTLYKLTNPEGRFLFDGLAPGAHALRISHVSYEEIAHHGIDAVVGSDREIEIRLLPRVFLLDEITVSPGTFSFMDTGTSGPQTMSREDIMSVPQIAEDVFRAVNRLPGLSSGDYAAHFSIRGGRHDETLILLDGLELYEPYHLKDFNEGAISIIDAEMVQGVELMTGGFPATYGNKRSGVFKITSRIPDRGQYSVGLSFINARAMPRNSSTIGPTRPLRTSATRQTWMQLTGWPGRGRSTHHSRATPAGRPPWRAWFPWWAPEGTRIRPYDPARSTVSDYPSTFDWMPG